MNPKSAQWAVESHLDTAVSPVPGAPSRAMGFFEEFKMTLLAKSSL